MIPKMPVGHAVRIAVARAGIGRSPGLRASLEFIRRFPRGNANRRRRIGDQRDHQRRSDCHSVMTTLR
ncbi:hypothetical protein [Actinokineospora fastidiosa]|uniref:hypothetical protein n=1 Tax=Actinokineospora fastidiosa TaxID=1816 RepID=UPI0016703905|nr:hypothetical protein [Actinokineospora fastidiosa]